MVKSALCFWKLLILEMEDIHVGPEILQEVKTSKMNKCDLVLEMYSLLLAWL